MQPKHPNNTCRVLGIREMRNFEYYLKSRNMDSRSMYFGCAVSDQSITDLVDHMIANSSDHKVIVDRKSTRLNSSHIPLSRMPSSA